METNTDEKTIKNIKFIYDEVIRYAKRAIELTQKLKLTNSQAFINFQDRLNELSIYEYGNRN